MVLSHSDYFFIIFCCLHNLMNIFAKKNALFCTLYYSIKGKKYSAR